ncbi:MAG: Fic family protein [Chlamydiota bacterium]
MWQVEIPEGAEPLGYKKLIEVFHLKTIPHFCFSYASLKWEKREIYWKDYSLTIYIYPSSCRLSENIFEHLEFALKHEGLNLYILKKVLLEINPTEITTYIQSRPTGKYARMLWYLYEEFNETKLLIPPLNKGSYVSLLDSNRYYCGSPRRSSRHRIINNLLGDVKFAPMVRKSVVLQEYEKKQINKKACEVVQQYDLEVLSRAMRYLYTKETMSSWEIEREKPDQAKLMKFVRLLSKADAIGTLSEARLIELQKNIIDSRFCLNAYRDFQNYVGEEPLPGQLIVHYIAPRPEDVRELMRHLIEVFDLSEKSGLNPVIAAAILSFIFVYIHPFEDGNGRIHRFLIHYALTRMKFTPEDVVFPVSSVIARDIRSYDKILESFSKPLMELITEYSVNDLGEMKVHQDTSDFYRYIDITAIAEYLYDCVDKTITIDFQRELIFLTEYDTIKRLCKEVVDMSDQRMDLFIRCVNQNQGVLSSRKRESSFGMLSDEEIHKMEDIIKNHSSLKDLINKSNPSF